MEMHLPEIYWPLMSLKERLITKGEEGALEKQNKKQKSIRNWQKLEIKIIKKNKNKNKDVKIV